MPNDEPVPGSTFGIRRFSSFGIGHSPLTTRPLYRQIGGRVLDGWHRALNVFDRAVDPSGLPVPPAHLRAYYYRTRDIAAFVRARDVVRTEVLSHGLKPSDRVLDIGSGIGNLALALAPAHTGAYEGVEIH